jgi:hypothetical protein
MKLFIKYMVSLRCKMLVKEELKRLGLHFVNVELGTVEVMETLTPENRELLRVALFRSGLELIDDKKAILIEKIQNVIVEMVHYMEQLPKQIFRIT